MSDNSETEFAVRINGGRKRPLKVATSIYQYAVAAIPALFNIGAEKWPVHVEIWFPALGKDARHHHMIIRENEFGHMVIGTAVRAKEHSVSELA